VFKKQKNTHQIHISKPTRTTLPDVFGLADLQAGDFFEWAPCQYTRSHKLYTKRCSTRVRSIFFTELVVNIWNSLPASVDLFLSQF